MLIQLHGWEIREALENYIKEKVGDKVEFCEDDYPSFKFEERKPIFERYKNGVIKRRNDGSYIIKKWEYEKKYSLIDDDTECDLWLS